MMIKKGSIILFYFICSIVTAGPLISVARSSVIQLSADHPNVDDRQYKRSLDALQRTVPLPYNTHVRNQINAYAKYQKGRFSKMLGLSQYYFPIYEKVFRELKLPDELKYISIIESSLDPHAVSSMGAAGPWQFLYEYGKMYGLTINDSIDERKDPELASHAAAMYLQDSYDMYGDWLLAIASYNSGRNNIKWAMEKAGGATDYWSLRPYLPVETQNYVPAYIATVYLMNNYRKHGIVPGSPGFNIQTEIIQLDKSIALEAVARQLNMNLDILYRLNPSYIQKVINGTKKNPKPLIIPELPTFSYNNLCAFLGIPGRKPTQPVTQAPRTARYFISYRVQQGDSLASIASKFKGVTVEEIQRTNRIAGDPIKAGTLLKISQYQ